MSHLKVRFWPANSARTSARRAFGECGGRGGSGDGKAQAVSACGDDRVDHAFASGRLSRFQEAMRRTVSQRAFCSTQIRHELNPPLEKLPPGRCPFGTALMVVLDVTVSQDQSWPITRREKGLQQRRSSRSRLRSRPSRLACLHKTSTGMRGDVGICRSLRWTWQVQYYTVGAFGTNRYPPFTLAEVPGHPAHLRSTTPSTCRAGWCWIGSIKIGSQNRTLPLP